MLYWFSMFERWKKILIFITAISLIVSFDFCHLNLAAADENNAGNIVNEISDLDKQINAKKKEIENLQERADIFKKNIEQKKMEALSLGNQIAILDNQIAKIELDTEATEKRIEEIALEIKSLELQIQEKEDKIIENKKRLTDLLNLIYRSDQKKLS